MVPNPRFKPLLSVAPETSMLGTQTYVNLCANNQELELKLMNQSSKPDYTCKELEDDDDGHYSPHGIFSDLFIERVEQIEK